MSDYTDLLYDIADGIATITLNRPDRLNAISGPMLASLGKAGTPMRISKCVSSSSRAPVVDSVPGMRRSSLKTPMIAAAGLASVFVLGVIAPAFGSGTWALWAPQLLVMMATAFVAGRLGTPSVAPVTGAAIGFGALLAAVYGSYAAHELGLWGLEANDFGSDDMPGHNAVLVAIILFGVPLTLIGATAGFAGAVWGRFSRT